MNWFLTYLLSLVIFLIIDGIFIGLFATKAYRRELGSIVAEKIKPSPGILFYLLYIAGILLLGVWPLLHFFPANEALTIATSLKAFLWGGALGFMAYGTYGFTALTLVKGWTWKVTLIDAAWGVFITGLITLIGFYIIR